MRKKFLIGFSVSFSLVILCFGLFLAYALHVHNEGIGEGTPYTLEELKALQVVLDPPRAPGTKLPKDIPVRVNHVLSNDTPTSIYKKRRQRVGWRAMIVLMKLKDGIEQIQGKPSRNGLHTASGIAYAHMGIDEIEVGRKYLWVAIDQYKHTDPQQCKFALQALARIESNPEKAALLIQLSCQGTDENSIYIPNQLLGAYWLCNKMDSPKLGMYYLERLWAEYPEKAQEYVIRHKIPVIKGPS